MKTVVNSPEPIRTWTTRDCKSCGFPLSFYLYSDNSRPSYHVCAHCAATEWADKTDRKVTH